MSTCPRCGKDTLVERSDILPTPPGTSWPPLPRWWFECSSCGYDSRPGHGTKYYHVPAQGTGTCALVFHRPSRFRLSTKLFELHIDLELVGEIANGETKTIYVSPGRHHLNIHAHVFMRDLVGGMLSITLTEGQTVHVSCEVVDYKGKTYVGLKQE
jgi:hypothetical protein